MTPVIAVFNAGSSSLKFSVFRAADLGLLHKGATDVADTPNGQRDALKQVLGWITAHADGLKLAAAGHRVVHGKDRTTPARVTPQLMEELKTLIPLAPLHQPHNLRIIEELAMLHPDLPQIACFDTAFHQTQPKLARMFALPRHCYDEGIRRYGFHGLSYDYIASELPRHAGDKAHGRVIAAHLGNGASLCAMQNLKSVAVSMGFSTLDGLMMGTRCGVLDAGVVLYLQQHLEMSNDAVENLLYHQSGLLGVSASSNDMRTLEASHAPEAKEAIDLFCHMAVQQIGGMIALLGGLDAIVFTGGIGEHSARVRAGICAYLQWLGLALDDTRNNANVVSISADNSRVAVYTIPTDEEIVIARACKILA